MTTIISVLLIVGSVFVLLAALGLVRFKDVFLQLHAAAKAATLGCGLIFLGVIFQFHHLHTVTEAIVLIFFLALTAPIAAHFLAKAAYKKGVELDEKTRSSDS